MRSDSMRLTHDYSGVLVVSDRTLGQSGFRSYCLEIRKLEWRPIKGGAKLEFCEMHQL